MRNEVEFAPNDLCESQLPNGELCLVTHVHFTT